MTNGRDRLVAGPALRLPSGAVLLPISRLHARVHGVGGGWWVAWVRHDPHALLLREPGGALRVLAAGPDGVTLAALAGAVPQWEQVLARLHGEPASAPAAR